jgi:hypothetical protein
VSGCVWLCYGMSVVGGAGTTMGATLQSPFVDTFVNYSTCTVCLGTALRKGERTVRVRYCWSVRSSPDPFSSLIKSLFKCTMEQFAAEVLQMQDIDGACSRYLL